MIWKPRQPGIEGVIADLAISLALKRLFDGIRACVRSA